MLSKECVEEILSIVPDGAKCCYTGQSILAYCPDPTFTWEEVNTWEEQTDIDIFCYNIQTQASLIREFIKAGFQPKDSVEEFKVSRICFCEPNRKFSLQTVKLDKEGMPEVNISWRKNQEDCIDVIKAFDMDYLMVSMDISKRIFADFRGENHRVAHVNKFNARFDPYDAEPSFWYRQFDRCPKGWGRGIDTRPVARQYAEWIRNTLSKGDTMATSKTRYYADRAMREMIAPVVECGFTEDQAIALYHMFTETSPTWDGLKLRHESMLKRIETWLSEVEDL